jgi:hypothetical protein
MATIRSKEKDMMEAFEDPVIEPIGEQPVEDVPIEMPKTMTKAELISLAIEKVGLAEMAATLEGSLECVSGDVIVRRRVLTETIDRNTLMVERQRIEQRLAQIDTLLAVR